MEPCWSVAHGRTARYNQRVEFRLLGPLQLRENGDTIELGAAKERTLLAVLLLHPNETVSTARLVDELWGEQPPASATRLVHTYVSHLRKLLGDTVVTRPPGYAIEVDADQLDLTRFQQLLDEAEGQPAAEASRTLGEALDLWRGRALEDVTLESFARQDVERLEDLRVTALARRIDHDLELGRHEELVPELQRLIAENPYRERFVRQLMLALYRSGRQADALETFIRARATYASELGLEPGPELRELQAQVLRHDPALAAPARGGTRRRPTPIAAIALLAAAAAVTVVGWLATRGPSNDAVAVGPNAVAIVDPQTNRVVAGVPVGIDPGPLAVSAGSVWVGNGADETLSRIDPNSRRVVRTIPLEGSPTALAVSGDRLWAVSNPDRLVHTVDLQFDSVRTRALHFPNAFGENAVIPARPTGITARGGAAWLVTGSGLVLDDHGKRLAEVPVMAADVVMHGGSLWVVQAPWVAGAQVNNESVDLTGSVLRVDPTNGQTVFATTLGRYPGPIAAGLGSLWVVNSYDGTVAQLDDVTARVVRTFQVGKPPLAIGPCTDRSFSVGCGGGLAVGEGAVWIADGRRKALIRLDPGSGQVTGIPLDAAPIDVAVGHGEVWLTLRRNAGA